MFVPARDIPAENEPRYLNAHEQVFNPLVTLMGQIAYALVCLFIYLLYKPVAPVESMRLWLAIATFVFTTVALLDIAYVIRRPDREETFAVWRKLDKKVPMAFDVVAVGVLLLLYPHGHESLKILTVAFFVGYVPLQMISDPENAAGNRISTIAVLGSFTLSLVWNGDLIEHVLAVMIVIYGTVLFVASAVLRRVVITAVDARLESERNAAILSEALADVSASRDAKTRFIAAASHDLGQPLQAAGLYFRQVLQATSKRQREKAAQGVRDAFAAADQLLAHMLNHLSLKADAVKPHFSQVKAGPLMKKLVRRYAPIARASGKEIRMVASSLSVWTDPQLAERAIGNYISNSIQHAQGTRILLGIRRDGPDRVRIWVIDDGQGILEADAQHVFDEYYRGAESISNTKGGFGIGLASVMRIAMLVGGTAGCDRRRRKGAAFFLDLPGGAPLP